MQISCCCRRDTQDGLRAPCAMGTPPPPSVCCAAKQRHLLSYESPQPPPVRLPYPPPGSRLLYVRDRYLRVHELQTGRDHPLVSMRRPGQSQGASLGQGPRSLQHNTFNPAESNVLVSVGCFVPRRTLVPLPLLLLLLLLLFFAVVAWFRCCVCGRCLASHLSFVGPSRRLPSLANTVPLTKQPPLEEMLYCEPIRQAGRRAAPCTPPRAPCFSML